ncbi:MAG: ROK family protein [Sphingopyxis sp.]|jgi:fructokinase|nr:ROK family protein [Sphingopyxis sp.]
MAESRFALVESGGTKWVLAVAGADRTIHAHHRIPTTTPAETIGAALQWFAEQGGDYTALGIASFGPLDLDPHSAQWGSITRTTKPDWSHTDVARHMGRALGCPVAIDTDVNGAALAESRWGAGHGAKISVYLTIGTGVGGGAIVDGAVLRGASHPEMGHMRVPRHADDHAFAGICPFHGDCLEGLASGPAVSARWGASLSDLPADHPGHDIIAWYLAQAAVTLQAIMEPQRIILGGGVMGTPGLLDRVRVAAAALGKGYFVGDPATAIVAPGLGDQAGILGALALALDLKG